jgi:hypothetical protein
LRGADLYACFAPPAWFECTVGGEWSDIAAVDGDIAAVDGDVVRVGSESIRLSPAFTDLAVAAVDT